MNKQMKLRIKKICSSFFKVLFKIIGQNNAFLLMERICVSLNESTDYFVNFTVYPKRAEKYVDPILFRNYADTIGIVIQGPVLTKDDFTLETVRLYKKIYPGIRIILSTWSSTPKDVLNSFYKENVDLIISDLPEQSGIGNINYQVSNTRAGLLRAKSLGLQYVAKTRTDQRLNRRNLFEFLTVVLQENPPKNIFESIHQKDRIVILEGTKVGSSLLIPGYISDFFYFGNTDDIIGFFSFEFQNISQSGCSRKDWLSELRKTEDLLSYFSQTAPEVMLYNYYLRNEHCDNPLKQYWKFLKNFTVGVSWSDLGLFWCKYNDFLMTNKLFGNYSIDDTDERKLCYGIDYITWKLIQELDEVDMYEKYCHYKAKIIEGNKKGE